MRALGQMDDWRGLIGLSGPVGKHGVQDPAEHTTLAYAVWLLLVKRVLT